jgi:type VI secretion system secreted protein VgrG
VRPLWLSADSAKIPGRDELGPAAQAGWPPGLGPLPGRRFLLPGVQALCYHSAQKKQKLMADPTQALRRIAIDTPLGPDVLLVRRCSIREQMSRLFRLDLNLISKKHDLNFDDLIGKSATVRLELANQTRYFNGFVSRFVQTKSERSYAVYQMTLVPWLWFLTRTSDCKIFQQSMQEPPDEMTVPGIIKKVFKDAGFEDFRDDGLSETYRTWEFCVQYRETAFNFVSRLMEQEGIGYFFEHQDGKHTLVLTDSINAHTPFENYDTVPYHPHRQGSRDKEAVTDWVVEKELQPGTFAHNDYDFEKPKQAVQKALVVKSTITRPHDKADFEIYDYPGEFLAHDEGESLAKLRIEELQVQHETLRGQATALGLCAGCTFSLESHSRGDQNREYLILNTAYDIDAGEFETGRGGADEPSWTCQLTAIPSGQPFRPARLTPKPLIQGVQTALVVGPSGEEIHTDEHARVKVQFHWDRYGNHDENSSCWIRVSQPWAGKGWGSQATPRIGQEVIVEFLEGDPDRPIITGRVYNGNNKPPYGKAGVVSGLKSQTHKGAGFNEISMDDTAGAEEIHIHGQFDMNTIVEHDQTSTIQNNRTDKIKVNDSESVGGDQTLHVKGKRDKTIDKNETETVKGDKTIEVKGAHSETIGKTMNLIVKLAKNETVYLASTEEVGLARNLTVGAAYTIEVVGAMNEAVGGAKATEVGLAHTEVAGRNRSMKVGKKLSIDADDEIEIKTGAASITMKKDGKIEIKGVDVTMQSGGGKVNIDAGGIITIKGPMVKINT